MDDGRCNMEDVFPNASDISTYKLIIKLLSGFDITAHVAEHLINGITL